VRVPFVELDTAALCSREGPDPFGCDLEVPFEVLGSPPTLILGAGRRRFLGCSFTAWRDPGSSSVPRCSVSAELSRRLRPRIWFAGMELGSPDSC
jgi:hypothetical protein